MSSTLPSWTLDRVPRFRLQVWTASRQVTVHEVHERHFTKEGCDPMEKKKGARNEIKPPTRSSSNTPR